MVKGGGGRPLYRLATSRLARQHLGRLGLLPFDLLRRFGHLQHLLRRRRLPCLTLQIQLLRRQLDAAHAEIDRLHSASAAGPSVANAVVAAAAAPSVVAVGSKMERSASMQRVASLEHLTKRVKPGSQTNLAQLAEVPPSSPTKGQNGARSRRN